MEKKVKREREPKAMNERELVKEGRKILIIAFIQKVTH